MNWMSALYYNGLKNGNSIWSYLVETIDSRNIYTVAMITALEICLQPWKSKNNLGGTSTFFLGSQHFLRTLWSFFCNFFKGGDFFAAFSILTCLETDFLRRVIFNRFFLLRSCWFAAITIHFFNGCKNKRKGFYCVYYYRDDDENVSLLKLSFCIWNDNPVVVMKKFIGSAAAVLRRRHRSAVRTTDQWVQKFTF